MSVSKLSLVIYIYIYIYECVCVFCYFLFFYFYQKDNMKEGKTISPLHFEFDKGETRTPPKKNPRIYLTTSPHGQNVTKF